MTPHVCIDLFQTPLTVWQAAEKGDWHCLCHHLQSSLHPQHLLNSRDPVTECTLLHSVLTHHSEPYSLVKLLLDYGVDPTLSNVYSVQALHVLFLHCPSPLPSLHLLLQHYADPNARDGDDWTPLHYAARFCPQPLPAITLLTQYGADINATDSCCKSPMFALLANKDCGQSMAYFIRHANLTLKAPITLKNHSSVVGTVLLQAAKYQCTACLLLLTSPPAQSILTAVMTEEELTLCTQLVLAHSISEGKRDEGKRDAVSDTIVQRLEEWRARLPLPPISLYSSTLQSLFYYYSYYSSYYYYSSSSSSSSSYA
ncbi:ankyrin repeat-containing domain protein [Spinellus fusiger]|nr:ankyrin repeat-containing domain protein [Spinellus fusiger]